MDNDRSERPRAWRQRPWRHGIFWPLLLIGIGIAFLLSNLGLISVDLWSLLVSLWPLLLIVGGLDGIIKGEGLTGSTLAIGLGIAFLLSNYGYLDLNPLEVIIRLWPLFLVAAGFDLILGRRSWLAGLAGAVVMAALLVGLIWSFGVRQPAGVRLDSEQVTQTLDGATQAQVRLLPGAGELHLAAMPQPQGLIGGTVPANKNVQVVQDFSRDGDRAVYELRQREPGTWSFAPNTSLLWDLQLNPDIPTELRIELGVGDAELDLSGLQITDLRLNLGIGQAEVILPAEGQYTVRMEGGIGQLIVIVPQGLGVHVQRSTGLSRVDLPDGYTCSGEICKSPGYGDTQNRVELRLNQGIGDVQVREQ